MIGLMMGIFFLFRCGPANPNNANDNTSGVVTVLEIMRTLLPAYRKKVCFVLFDLEEAGLIGSAAYRKAHKAATEKQLVLNLDCVGDGDSIIFFPSKKLKKDADRMNHLKRCGGWFGFKHISVHEKGYASYPSDHVRFPLSVGIGAFHEKNGKNPVLNRIHTVHDTVLDKTNVNILRACISTLISMQLPRKEKYYETV
jgi:aminopeptidase-like protein